MKKRPIFLPNIVTALALSCGLFVIFKMSLLPQEAIGYEQVLASVGILMLAAFLDFMDGAIARIVGAESYFGGVFDALSDAVSFGVAPSVLVLKSVPVAPETPLFFCLTVSAMVYTIAGILRLVRFRVADLERKMKKDETLEEQSKKYFTGLPIPAAALTTVGITLFLITPKTEKIFPVTLDERAQIASIVFFIMGYFMISRWKFPSLKSLHREIPSFLVLLVTASLAVLFLFAAITYFSLVLVAIFLGYIFIAVLLSCVRRISGKKLDSLEDFDAEEENNT